MAKLRERGFPGARRLETPRGIFTGGSQNLGDLPFHLGAIFSFTEWRARTTPSQSIAE